MSQQNINIGTGPSAGDGDPLRTAFSKINQNFTELYSNVGSLTNSVTSVSGRTGNVILTTQDIVGFNTNNFATVSYVQSVVGNTAGNISSLNNNGYTFSIDAVGDIVTPNNTVFLTAGGDITLTPADDLRLNGGSTAAGLQQEGGDIIVNAGTGSDANISANISAGGGGDIVINGGTAGGTAGDNTLGSIGGDISFNGGYTTLDGSNGGNISFAAGSSVSDNSGNISFRTSNINGTNDWAFNNLGELTFPNGHTISTGEGDMVLQSPGGVSLRRLNANNDPSSYMYVSHDTIALYPRSEDLQTQAGWTFDSSGILTLPLDGQITGGNIIVKGSSSVSIKVTSLTNPLATRDWGFGGNGHLTFPDSTSQTTAYPGKLLTTIATTGEPFPGTGEVSTVTLTPTNNTNFVPGTYPGIFLALNAGFSITLTVATNGDLTASVISSGAGFSIGDQAILNGAAIAGGTTGIDNIAVDIATITNISVPAALDLTKQVQKLTNGWYSLANGVEGQVMYLVRQDDATSDQVTLTVASGRVNGVVYPDILYTPFTFNSLPNDLITLIFTDNAWQSNNGAWD